ncbi:MAG TPA: WbuC family cupin fold metalloprotein [Candidatus Nanoarchaeia archaeon]|nr:WbuC family cupin fold metalloprotein [Candidatus Nanoarchaeia archaeon]
MAIEKLEAYRRTLDFTGLTVSELESLVTRAIDSDRRRATFNLGTQTDPLQKLVTAIMYGSYVMPHMHDKDEMIKALLGRVAAVTFNEYGELLKADILVSGTSNDSVEIMKRQWHSLVCLPRRRGDIIDSGMSIVYNTTEGPYIKENHAVFANFAPAEDSIHAVDYLNNLTSLIRQSAEIV